MILDADVRTVFHNAASGAFEADVVLSHSTERYTYDVEVTAPITAEFETLRPQLVAAALRAHHQKAPAIIQRQVETPHRNRTDEMLERVLFGTRNYLD